MTKHTVESKRFSDEAIAVLRQPGALALYQQRKHEAWIEPFLETKDRTLNRLGAQLLVFDLLVTLDARWAARDDRAREEWERRDLRMSRGPLRGGTRTCGRCGVMGHNVRTCKTDVPVIEWAD